MADDATASLSVLAVSATVTVIPHFLPKLSEVHHMDSSSIDAADVRIGEAATVLFLVSVGSIASSIAGTSAPLKMTLLMSLFIVGAYETALRNNFGVVTDD